MIKIENFEREHTQERFPWFRTLLPAETKELRRRICGKIQLSCDTDGLSLVRALFAVSQVVDQASPQAENFDLAQVARRLSIDPEQYIYINWYRFDHVDCMRVEDLTEYFDDLWYPSEDIEIFDNTLSWILFILHFDQVRVADLRERNETGHTR